MSIDCMPVFFLLKKKAKKLYFDLREYTRWGNIWHCIICWHAVASHHFYFTGILLSLSLALSFFVSIDIKKCTCCMKQCSIDKPSKHRKQAKSASLSHFASLLSYVIITNHDSTYKKKANNFFFDIRLCR